MLLGVLAYPHRLYLALVGSDGESSSTISCTRGDVLLGRSQKSPPIIFLCSWAVSARGMCVAICIDYLLRSLTAGGGNVAHAANRAIRRARTSKVRHRPADELRKWTLYDQDAMGAELNKTSPIRDKPPVVQTAAIPDSELPPIPCSTCIPQKTTNFRTSWNME